MPSRRSVLRGIGVSALGLNTLMGSSVATATSAESFRSREPTEFGAKETQVVNEFSGSEDPVGYLSTTVTGYDSFPKERDDVWFSAVSSVPIEDNGKTTSLVDASIEVKPRSVPEAIAPRIDSIDTFSKGTQITLEDENRPILVKGLEVIWENTVNRFSPIVFPAPDDFGVSPGHTQIDKDHWRGNTNAAFSAEWGTDSEILSTFGYTDDVAVLTADFQLSFRAAGDDGHTLQGTYIYDVIFEATFRHPLIGGYNSDYRTVTNKYTINFVVGDSDDGGYIGCGVTHPYCIK